MEQFMCFLILLCGSNSVVLGQSDYREKIMESLKQSLSHYMKPYNPNEMKRDTTSTTLSDNKNQFYSNSFKYSHPEAVIAGFEDYGGSGQMNTENSLLLSPDTDYATDVYNANLGLKGTTVTLPTHGLNSGGLNTISDFGGFHYSKPGYGSVDLPKQFMTGVSMPLSHYGNSVGNIGGMFSNSGYNYDSPLQMSNQHHNMAPLNSYNVPLATVDSSYVPKYHLTSSRPQEQPAYAVGHKGLGHFGFLPFPKRQVLNTRVSDYALKRPLFPSRPNFYKTSTNFGNSKYDAQHLNSALLDNSLGANTHSKFQYGISSDYPYSQSASPLYQALNSNDGIGYSTSGLLQLSSSSDKNATPESNSKLLDKTYSSSSITT